MLDGFDVRAMQDAVSQQAQGLNQIVLQMSENERNSPENRAARAAEETNDKLSSLHKRLEQLTDALESERALRQAADKKQEKMAWITLWIAILTLIANWGAVVLAIIFR